MDSITICNLALAKIGDQSIVSFTDGSIEARFCLLYYPVVVKELLLSNSWNFATKLVKLTQLSDSPLFEWKYAYQLPTDYGRTSAFDQESSATPMFDFEVMGNVLLTDQPDAELAYVSVDTNESLFTPIFVNALATKLAVELCRPLSGSTELKEHLKQELRVLIGDAGQIDANDSRALTVQPWVNSALVQSRYAGNRF